jgi:hypothetical protein
LVPSASWRSFRNASHSLVTLQQTRNQPLPPNVQYVVVAMGSPLSTVITCDSYSSNGDTQHNNAWSSHRSPPSHHMYRYMEQPWRYHIPCHRILIIKVASNSPLYPVAVHQHIANIYNYYSKKCTRFLLLKAQDVTICTLLSCTFTPTCFNPRGSSSGGSMPVPG